MRCTIVIILIIQRVTAPYACTFSLVPFQLSIVFKAFTTFNTHVTLNVRVNKSVGFQVSPVSILIVTIGAFMWLSCVFQCVSFQITFVLE